MKKKTTVGFDVSPLYSDHRVRGIGFYTQRLIKELKKLKELKVVALKTKTEIKRANYDLLHLPYFSPYFLTLPWRKRRPLVVTIHDLTPVKYPQHYPPGIRGRFRWEIQKRLLRKADVVITDSFASQKDIVKFTGYSREKIKVIYLAADSVFRVIKDRRKLRQIRKKYRLPSRFVLYVGDVNWNKNVPGLVRACEKIGVPLVIVGKQAVSQDFDWQHPENRDLVWLQNYYSNLKPETQNLFLVGFVPTEDLVALYNLATVYCQPSFDEGFGLPVLEAMACGCPVVSSDRGSLPEIVGGGGILTDPSEEKLALRIEKVLRNSSLRKRLSQKGGERAREFSWEKTTEATAKVYQRVLNK